jgi:hypothetical protein
MANKTEVIVRELPTKNGLETCNLYIKNATVFYAAVHEPKKKYQAEEKEFSLTAFVDEATKDKLLDEVMVNKTFALVGKDKTSKPPRRIKYPLSSQVEEGKVNYDVVDGMYGFTVAKPEFSKKGNPMTVNVIGADGTAFTENVGNGSVCTLKLFAYRNQDNQLVITLDTVQVLEHVPYEQKASADSVEDDILGVSYKVKKVEAKAEEAPAPMAKAKAVAQVEPEDDFETDLPF